MSNCRICKAKELKKNKFTVDLPAFAHSNFKLINKTSSYKVCKNCGLVSVLPNHNSLKFLKSLSSKNIFIQIKVIRLSLLKGNL